MKTNLFKLLSLISLWIVGGVILSPDAKAATDTFKLVKSIDELTDGGTYILYANSNVAASWNSKKTIQVILK
jgi:hypothetical protein